MSGPFWKNKSKLFYAMKCHYVKIKKKLDFFGVRDYPSVSSVHSSSPSFCLGLNHQTVYQSSY